MRTPRSNLGSMVRSYPFTRRRFLVALSFWTATGCAGRNGFPAPQGDFPINLDRFIQMSRTLTGLDDLRAGNHGQTYLDALLNRRDDAIALARLWRMGGFESDTPPASVADLIARGVYEIPDVAALADRITASWYSGIHVDAEGQQRVVTYTDALAWRTLNYRAAGPSACGGGFGHWAELPAGA